MPTATIGYPKVYTVEEFAQIFKVSPEAVRNLIRRGGASCHSHWQTVPHSSEGAGLVPGSG